MGLPWCLPILPCVLIPQGVAPASGIQLPTLSSNSTVSNGKARKFSETNVLMPDVLFQNTNGATNAVFFAADQKCIFFFYLFPYRG